MTDKVLSQDEVDALLKGVATGDVDTEESTDFSPDGLRLYDFTSQDRVIRGRMPGLEKINDAFSNRFRTAISSLIMKYIDVSIENVETIKYSDFIKTIPMPSSINIFTMEPLKGYSMLILEAPLV
jgi:flagellar motor switch protein FliM